MFAAINEINFEEVLTILWIEYKKISWWLALYEEWKLTDWWKCNTRLNYINDFSEKGRAIGSPYSFVKKYLDLKDKEVFARFKDKFGLEDNRWYRKHYKAFKKKKPVCSGYNRTRILLLINLFWTCLIKILSC